MEHEMRLAVLPYDRYGHGHPMIMPYCVGCGWVSERRYYPLTAESVPAEWRTHVVDAMAKAREQITVKDVIDAFKVVWPEGKVNDERET